MRSTRTSVKVCVCDIAPFLELRPFLPLLESLAHGACLSWSCRQYHVGPVKPSSLEDPLVPLWVIRSYVPHPIWSPAIGVVPPSPPLV